MPDSFLLGDNNLAPKDGEKELVTVDRVEYVTINEHGGHPAGTKCFAQRKHWIRKSIDGKPMFPS